MTKRHPHAVDRNRTDHDRHSHVAQYGIIVINGIDATAKQHDERRWGGGQSNRADGAEGEVARQPELAGLRGRQGGGWRGRVGGIGDGGGWQGGAGEATGADRLARGLRS